MKSDVTIYHNPRGATSRETLALLRSRGVEPHIVEYLRRPSRNPEVYGLTSLSATSSQKTWKLLTKKLKDPPSKDEIRRLIRMRGDDPHALLRTKEALYRELGLSPSSSMDEIVVAIAAHPIPLEHPVVTKGTKAVLGRPPDNALKVL